MKAAKLRNLSYAIPPQHTRIKDRAPLKTDEYPLQIDGLVQMIHLSHEKNPGWLGFIGDYTVQLYGDYNKLLEGSLLNNQYNGK